MDDRPDPKEPTRADLDAFADVLDRFIGLMETDPAPADPLPSALLWGSTWHAAMDLEESFFQMAGHFDTWRFGARLYHVAAAALWFWDVFEPVLIRNGFSRFRENRT